MRCLLFNLNTSETINEVLAKVIESEQVAGNDKTKAILIADGLENHLDDVIQTANNYLENQGNNTRIDYLEDNRVGTIENLTKLNPNQLSAILNAYYRKVHNSVTDYAAVREGYELQRFSSQVALEYAKSYTGSRIRMNYLRYANNPKFKGKDGIYRIINITAQEIIDDYYNEILPDFIAIKEKEIEENVGNLPNNMKGCASKIADIRKLTDEINSLAKELRAEKDATKHKEIDAKYQAKRAERAAAVLSFVEKYGSQEVKNYAALYNQVRYNFNNWFFDVLKQSSVNKVYSNFAKLDVDDIYENISFDTAEDFENAEQDRDENNGWDKGKVANDYKKLVDSKFQIYLGTALYKLSSPYSGAENEQLSYARNNPLGVRENYDGENLYIQLVKFVKTGDNFNSVNDLINKLTQMATEIPEYYGIMPMVIEMKTNPVFANNVYRNLANYKVKKATVKINPETGNIEVSRSNNNADVISKQYLKLLNDFAYNFIKVDNSLQERIKNLNYKENLSAKDLQSLINTVVELFKTIAPNYSYTTIVDFIENAKTQDIQNFIYHIQQLNNVISTSYDEYIKAQKAFNEKLDTFRKKNRAYNQQCEDVQNNVIPEITLEKPTRPNFNIFDELGFIDNKELQRELLSIIDLLNEYDTTTIELNSPNSKGNNSSNLIANSHISNLYEAIKESDSKGIESLIRQYGGLSQIEYNPFFYGIKDKTGNIVVPGLFIKQEDGSIIANPDFKNQFDIFLFDGIQKTDYSQAVTYMDATKGDYFLTQLLAFFNGISQPGQTEKGMAFFLDTPSDAQKNYIMSVPKLELDKIWNYKRKGDAFAVQKFITSIVEKLNRPIDTSKLTQKEVALMKLEGRDQSDIDANLMNQIDKLRSGSIIDKIKLYNILTNKDNTVYSVNNITISNGKAYVNYSIGDIDVLVSVNIDYIDSKKRTFKFGEVNNISILKAGKLQTYIPEELTNILRDNIIEDGVNNGTIEREINKDSQLFLGYKQILQSELYNYIAQLSNIIKSQQNTNTGGINYVISNNTDGLINLVHYNRGKVVNNGKLAGNFFKFDKLFRIGDYDVNKVLETELSLYGDVNSNALFIVTDNNEIYVNPNSDIIKLAISEVNGKTNISYEHTEQIDAILNKVVEDWLMKFEADTKEALNEYSSLLDGTLNRLERTTTDVVNFVLATSYIRLATEPLLTGDSKFYAKKDTDVRTYLKRAKEVQAGGQVYNGGDIYEEPNTGIHNLQYNNQDALIFNSIIHQAGVAVPTPIYARNGFRAVTIANTVKTSEYADIIRKQLEKSLGQKVKDKIISKTVAERLINYLTEAYKIAETKVNDAQSYITFEEWVRRRYADGTYNNYKTLIDTINKLRNHEITLADIDINSINQFIQVQKNFYFDIKRDDKTGTMYPRQIKNAEFVIIPELVAGTDLENLYNTMIEAGIDQVNTIETSKAANRNILTFWDNNRVAKDWHKFAREISPVKGEYNTNVVEEYYYRNLWKQQDVAQHTVDEENKAGLQITKKIIDNATPAVQAFIDKFITNFSLNVKDSFNQMLFNMGWKVNPETGKLVNRVTGSEQLDFSEFYLRALQEAERLGMDSNFREYFEVDDVTGLPKMPNFMNINAEKQESVAQALFNSNVRKQTLPGWHMAQVTSVGTGVKDSTGVIRKLKYHSDEKGDFSPVIEIMIPRWSNKIPKYKPTAKLETESNDEYYTRIQKEKEDFDRQILDKLKKAGLLDHIIYRIPTEGKQSIAIARVVGFVDDVYGSTIFVPDEWVTQTGSDFDVDSIYGICHEFRYNEETGEFEKLEGNDKTDKTNTERRYISYIKELLNRGKIDTLKDTFNAYAKSLNLERRNAKSSLQEAIANILQGIKQSDYLKENYNRFNETLHSLPDNIQKGLTSIMGNINDEKGNDLSGRDVEYIKKLTKLSNNTKLTDAVKEKIQQLIDIVKERQELVHELNNVEELKASKRLEDKKYREALLEIIGKLAKEYDFITYDEFAKLSIDEQQNRSVRNNKIVDSFIEILSDASSFEENMSRSNFDDITANNKTIEKRISVNQKHNKAVANTLTQIQFFEDAIMGARLKARSVQRDTFLSVSNKVHGKLKTPIKVAYDLNQTVWNDQTGQFEEVFEGKDLEEKRKNLSTLYHEPYKIAEDEYLVEHSELGWHRYKNIVTNRNILGRLMTVYSSETTAHILDAVKEGAILNETEDTFGVFKTLVDLGVDYTTAIGFLAQPAITKLVENFNNNKSIYLNDSTNAIAETMVQILHEAGVADVQSYNRLNNIIKKGVEYFNLDKSPILREKALYEAIDGKDTLAHQFEILMIFNQLNNITRHIENLIQCCNPDKFGAKQTIHSTKRTLVNIYEYGFNRQNADINLIVNEDGVPFLQALYPGLFDESGLNESFSSYAYLASFLKYSTIPATIVNSQLFTLESPTFALGYEELVGINNGRYTYGLAEIIEHKIGRKLTDDEYRKYKKYIVSSVFNENKTLVTPLTVDGFNRLVPSTGDLVIAEKNTENDSDNSTPHTNYWNREKVRIFGFGANGHNNIKIKDKEHPTEKELAAFAELTPAQKVDWIKMNFNDAGIFNYIITNYNAYGSIRTYGINSNSLQVEFGHDPEILYSAFRKAAFSKNPLIKLAAADLVKYAFIVEGHNFKAGAISRIITNDFLYVDNSSYGFTINPNMSFIEELSKGIRDIDLREKAADDFIEKFIRQNNSFIKELTLNLRNDEKANTSERKLFNASTSIDESVLLYASSKDSLSNKLIRKILGYGDYAKGYVKIKNNHNKVTLYKVKQLYKDNFDGTVDLYALYLYPIGILEENEYNDYSVKAENNPTYKKEYYEHRFEEIDGILAVGEQQGYKYVTKATEIDKVQKVEIPVYQVQELEDTEFQQILNREIGDDIARKGIQMLVEQIEDYIQSPVEGEDIKKHTIAATLNPYIIGLLKDKKPIIQELTINGVQQKVLISLYKSSSYSALKKVLMENAKGLNKKYTKNVEEHAVIDYLYGNKQASLFTLLKVEPIYESNEELNNGVEEQTEEENTRQAITSLVIDDTVLSSRENKVNSIDRFAGELAKRMYNKSKRSDNHIVQRFARKVATGELIVDDSASVIKNKRSIFAANASYYEQEANIILDRLKHYKIEDREFELNDPELYRELLKHPEYYDDLVELILYAKNFGRDIAEIFTLDVNVEDPTIQTSIDTIRKAINSVRNSNYINGENGAIGHIFNIYIAEKYSNNPLIRQDLVKLRTQFGDIDWFDLQIADAGFTNNKQIQTVLKLVYGIIDRVRDIEAPDAVRNFQKRFDELMSRGDINLDKIIDSKGRYLQKYTDKFFEDKAKVIDDYVEAQAKYGKYSKEAVKAKLARDEWFAKNIEQLLVKDYYDELNKATRDIIYGSQDYEEALDYYVEYLKLKDELNTLTYSEAVMSEDDIKRMKQLQARIAELRRENKGETVATEDGLFGVSDEPIYDRKSQALNNYIHEVQEINTKYKEYEPTESWAKTIRHYLTIMSDYDRTHPGETLNAKLENAAYREAYIWVNRNSSYVIDKKFMDEIMKNFASLRGDKQGVSKNIISWAKTIGAIDEFGRVDGRKLTLEQQRSIVDAMEKANARTNSSTNSDDSLITQVRSRKPIYTDKFYRDVYGEHFVVHNPERLAKIREINKILVDANAVTPNGIDMILLLEHLSVEQLRDLKQKIDEFYEIKGKKLPQDIRERLRTFTERRLDEEAFNADYLTVRAKYQTANPAKFVIWEQIFAERDENGDILREDNEPVASKLFYGWVAPLAAQEEQYIDKRKSEARDFINENIEFVTNEYYKEAWQKAVEDGNFEEWYKANHVYNQFSHRYEPTVVWTTMRLKDNADKNLYSYVPTFDNVERNPKEEYRNPNYQTYGSHYNATTGQYNNPAYDAAHLNNDEREMLDYLIGVARRYAINNGQRSFAETYAPRLMAHKADKKFWKNAVLDAVGFNYKAANNEEFHEEIDYLHDFDPDFQMFELLKDKGSKERIVARPRNEGETDEEYRKYLNDVKHQNDEIRQANLEIDNTLINRNWRDVFSRLVANGENYLARNKAKTSLYLLLEDLLENDAIKGHRITGRPIEDRNSPHNDEMIKYQTEKQVHAFKIMQTFARRLIYDEYKKQQKLVGAARVLQGFTSAKYMMLNIHGGVANVSTGLVNILGERLAGEYFSNKAWLAAELKYGTNILNAIADMYKDDASSFTNGLIKLVNAVDYDEINGELVKSDTAVEFARKLNDFLYSPNSMGEHYMQNTAALAMIEDARIYTDGNGGYKIGNINDYTRDVEIDTLRKLIIEWGDRYQIDGHSIIQVFDNYIKKIQNDKKYQYDFDIFRKDVCMEFIHLITEKANDDSKLAKEFITRRKMAVDKAKQDFANEARLIDQFEFVPTNEGRGVTRIKHNSLLNTKNDSGELDVNVGNTKFVEFTRRIKYVNKKIHGVYDKLGRATIENEWWGSLAMQYHKHIYPGIMKRYRGFGREFGLGISSAGYYNELLEGVEMGSYTSILRFLGIEFNKLKWGKKQEIDESGNVVDTDISALESLQNVGNAMIATITHASFNWNLLPAWEQRNILRALGDMMGIVGTALLVIGMYAMWDDDDFKDDMLLANAMYTANRMFSEAYMYIPTGLVSEFDSLWASPVAGGSNIKDALKGLDTLYQTLFDDDFSATYTTGQYKGRYKLEVLATRNTPVYRVYNNIINMGARNSYYNGGTGNSAAQAGLREIGKGLR